LTDVKFMKVDCDREIFFFCVCKYPYQLKTRKWDHVRVAIVQGIGGPTNNNWSDNGQSIETTISDQCIWM
jgi:hypothetical protein